MSNDDDDHQNFIIALEQAAANTASSGYFCGIRYLSENGVDEVFDSFSQLLNRAKVVAVHIQNVKNFQVGDRVLIVCEPGKSFVTAFYGCVFAGGVAVPVIPPHDKFTALRVQSIINVARPTAFLADTKVLHFLNIFKLTRWIPGSSLVGLFRPPAETAKIIGGFKFDQLDWIDVCTIKDLQSSKWRKPEVEEDPVVFIQFTSGSTGEPKGVIISHRNIVHQLKNLEALFGGFNFIRDHGRHNTVFVNFVPPYHDMGMLSSVLLPIYRASTVYIMSPTTFLKSPQLLLQKIAEYKAPISSGNNSALNICIKRVNAGMLRGLDFSCFKYFILGGEPIFRDTCAEFHRLLYPMSPNNSLLLIHPAFGMAETTLIVSGSPPSIPCSILRLDKAAYNSGKVQSLEVSNELLSSDLDNEEAFCLMSNGCASDGMTLLIVDPVSKLIQQEDALGELWVSGPSVAKGYFEQPDLTAEVFNAFTADGRGPFLRTGDTAFLHNGELYIAGRIKDIIIVAGKNYFPQDIENTLNHVHPLVRVGCSVAFAWQNQIIGMHEELLGIVMEVRREPTDEEASQLFSACCSAVLLENGVAPFAIYLVPSRTLPKSSSGKIMRQPSKQMLLAGQFKVVGTYIRNRSIVSSSPLLSESAQQPRNAEGNAPPDLDVLEAVLSIANSVLDSKNLEQETSLLAAGMDSIRAAEFASTVSQTLNCTVGADIVFQCSNCLEISNYVQAQLCGMIPKLRDIRFDVVPTSLPFPIGAMEDMSTGSKVAFSLSAPIFVCIALIRFALFGIVLFVSVDGIADVIRILSGVLYSQVKQADEFALICRQRRENASEGLVQSELGRHTSAVTNTNTSTTTGLLRVEYSSIRESAATGSVMVSHHDNPIVYLTNHSTTLDLVWLSSILRSLSRRPIRIIVGDWVLPDSLKNLLEKYDSQIFIILNDSMTLKVAIESCISDNCYDLVVSSSAMTIKNQWLAFSSDSIVRIVKDRASCVPVVHQFTSPFGAHTRLMGAPIYHTLLLTWMAPFWLSNIQIGALLDCEGLTPLTEALRVLYPPQAGLRPSAGLSQWRVDDKANMKEYYSGTNRLNLPELDEEFLNTIGKGFKRLYVKVDGILLPKSSGSALGHLWISSIIDWRTLVVVTAASLRHILRILLLCGDRYRAELESFEHFMSLGLLPRIMEAKKNQNVLSMWLSTQPPTSIEVVFVTSWKMPSSSAILQSLLRAVVPTIGGNNNNAVDIKTMSEIQLFGGLGAEDFLLTSDVNDLCVSSCRCEGAVVNPCSLRDELLANTIMAKSFRLVDDGQSSIVTSSSLWYVVETAIARSIRNSSVLQRSPFIHCISFLLHYCMLEKYIAVIGIALLSSQIYQSLLLDYTLVIVLTALVQATIKNLVRRPRPVWHIDNGIRPISQDAADDYSFPSGHTAFMTTLAFVSYEHGYRTLTGVCCGLVVATAINRLFRGAHYLSDIVGGCVLSLVLNALWFHAGLKSAMLHQDESALERQVEVTVILCALFSVAQLSIWLCADFVLPLTVQRWKAATKYSPEQSFQPGSLRYITPVVGAALVVFWAPAAVARVVKTYELQPYTDITAKISGTGVGLSMCELVASICLDRFVLRSYFEHKPVVYSIINMVVWVLVFMWASLAVPVILMAYFA